jgi:pyruvate dehydrogenase E1 component alpha subunit
MAEQEIASRREISTYDRGFLLDLYGRMYRIRRFEDTVKALFLSGSMPGTIHQCQGQEATAVGMCSVLGADDYVTSTHRPHGHALAKGVSALEMLQELFGKATGCCKGKGGSMHVGNMSVGMPPAIAIVAAGVPLATGMALAMKMEQRPNVVVCFFGDGATSEGAFHEGVNMGAIWDLPVIYACENNLYGASTHVSKVTRVGSIVNRCSGYGIPGFTIDGNDVLAVHEAAKDAAARCRAGEGPVLLELLTYRNTGHSRRDARAYQPDDEKAAWAERDPIKTTGRELLTRDDVTQADLDDVTERVDSEIDDAVEQARNDPEPTEADLITDVYAQTEGPR